MWIILVRVKSKVDQSICAIQFAEAAAKTFNITLVSMVRDHRAGPGIAILGPATHHPQSASS